LTGLLAGRSRYSGNGRKWRNMSRGCEEVIYWFVGKGILTEHGMMVG